MRNLSRLVPAAVLFAAALSAGAAGGRSASAVAAGRRLTFTQMRDVLRRLVG